MKLYDLWVAVRGLSGWEQVLVFLLLYYTLFPLRTVVAIGWFYFFTSNIGAPIAFKELSKVCYGDSRGTGLEHLNGVFQGNWLASPGTWILFITGVVKIAPINSIKYHRLQIRFRFGLFQLADSYFKTLARK